MDYGLREDLSFAFVGGRTVFLDVRADRYFCLKPAMEMAFRRVVEGEALDPSEATALEPLVVSGLLREMGGRPIEPAVAPTASFSAHDDWRQGGGVLAGLDALLMQMGTALSLKALRFPRVIDHLRRRKAWVQARASPASGEDLARISNTFRKTNVLFSQHNRCLLRAISISKILMNRMYAPHICFGVKMPFAAHCWVQYGDIIVGDEFDMVEEYTPILVI